MVNSYKFLSSLFFIAILFGGCSNKSAFDHFKLENANERAYANFQSKTVTNSSQKTEIVLSAIYLNQVLPDEYKNGENFLIAIYKDESSELDKNSLELNFMKPLSIRDVNDDSNLRDIMPIKSSWNHYYVVTFPTQESDVLQFIYETYRLEKVLLVFQKDE